MTLLKPNEPRSVEVAHRAARSVFVLTCDHASHRIPAALGSLGVPAAERLRHIAWDIGALAVAQGLAAVLDGVLISSGYSRLVMDVNRSPSRHDAIPTLSEATAIPGNVGLSAADRAMRQREIFEPYHAAIDQLLTARLVAGQATMYVAIHSFTPVYQGTVRPWHVALLSNRDRRVAEVLLAALACDPTLCVGDNIPYRVTDEGDYGIPVHAEGRGLPHVLIEIRQDEITTHAGQQQWISRLAPLLLSAQKVLGLA